MSVAPALGMISLRLAALGVLAVAGPTTAEAQIGLTSGGAQIVMTARVGPGVSINGVSEIQETVRQGTLSEVTVKLRLSPNTGYRVVAVGTAQVSSKAQPASRLWVRAENGRFEEVSSGTAVTVVRGRHAVAGREPEVSFRSEASESVAGSNVLPVRYEIRIDPTI